MSAARTVLLTRFLTAIVLLPLVLAGVYLLPELHFAWVTAVIFALAAYEWVQLTLGPASGWRWLFYAGFSAVCAFAWAYEQTVGQALLWVASIGWLWAIWEVVRVKTSLTVDARVRPHWVALGLILLPGAWLGLAVLRANDPHLLVAVCLVVWGADIGAYFVGRAIGRRKLAPYVSPGKTWEGALGGSVVGTLAALGFAAYFNVWAVSVALVVGLVALTGLAVFGDLFESVLKRVRGAKDSGRLLPGHGGVLDRVDALIAVLPVAALGTLLATGG